LLFVIWVTHSFGQDIIYTDRPVELTVNQELPKDLLSTKTIVIIDPGNSRQDWKKIAEQAHVQLRRTGIDAVGYFLRQNLFCGMGPQEELARHFTSREIANLIFIFAKTRSTEVWLTRFNSQWSFISMDQNAWYAKDSTVSKALLPLYQRAALIMEKKNLLILDNPEFHGNFQFDEEEIKKSYPPDMKSFKTGIVLIPVEPLTSALSDDNLPLFSGYEEQVSQNNRDIKEVMEGIFPFKYETVDFGTSEQDLKDRKGIQYLLYFVHANAKTIRDMLGFESPANATEFASNGFLGGNPFLISIPADRVVYKFYVKRLSTGELYSGSLWDADITLKDALSNFINNMKRELKINP